MVSSLFHLMCGIQDVVHQSKHAELYITTDMESKDQLFFISFHMATKNNNNNNDDKKAAKVKCKISEKFFRSLS